MFTLLHPALSGCFLFLLIYCMFLDFKERRIPNRAVAVMLAIAFFDLFRQLDAYSLAAAGAALLLLIPWKKGVIGAGDVKLIFVSALYLGLPDFCISLALMGMAAFIYIVFSRKRAADYVAMGAFFAPAAATIIILTGR